MCVPTRVRLTSRHAVAHKVAEPSRRSAASARIVFEMSGKQHKMVNLCMASYAAAGRMDNFSGWVRTQLLKEASGGDYGFDSEIVETIIALMNHEQLV